MGGLDLVVRALEERDCRPRGSRERGYRSLCPGHDNAHRLSLAVAEGRTQPIVIYCHAGCEPEAVLSALGLEWSDVCESDEAYR